MAASLDDEWVADLARRGMTDLAGRSVILLGAGQFSDAFLVGERVVRVPKSQVAMEGLRREVEFLAATRDQLRAQVPRVLETRFDMGPDEAFVVHGLIPGDVLHSAWLREMTEDELSGVAAEVANFVRSLHALAPDRAGSGLERSDLGSWWTALISAVEDEVVPHLAQDVGARFLSEIMPPADTFDAAPPVVCHGDLGGNLLWGPEGLGVIDFASCSVAHPAVELASLLVLGDRFLQALLSAYPDLTESLEAAWHIHRSFAAQDLLWSVRQGDLTRVRMIVEES